MRRTDWLVAAAMLLVAVGLVACGGGGSASGDSGGSEREAALAFTQCLRSHGVEVDDPGPGQAHVELPESHGPATEKALAACKGKLGSAGQELSAGEEEEFRESWLAFAECVREQGVEMADPQFRGNGQVLLDRSVTNSPAFEAAQDACRGITMELHGVDIGG